jgi:hypothetical protein
MPASGAATGVSPKLVLPAVKIVPTVIVLIAFRKAGPSGG